MADTLPTSTYGRHFASTNSCGILEPFEDEVKSLLKKSVSKSTWNVYENAIQSFERFRNQFGIENIWSPPIDHLINYIAFLSKKKVTLQLQQNLIYLV